MATQRITHITMASILLILALIPGALYAAEPNQAGLVIQFPDGNIVTRCIEFSETEISGYDIISRSGLALEVDFSNIGAAICKIEGTGCDPSECLTCDMQNYWAYWHWDGSAWQYARAGVSNAIVHAGDIEGWRWGPGEAPTEAFTLDDICAPPPTPTPAPTDTPQPTSTAFATATPAPDVQFRIDGDTVKAGTCTTLHWVAKNIASAHLNNEPVGSEGFVTVCPCETTDYELAVTYRDGSTETRRVTLNSTGNCAATATPRDTPTPGPTTAATATAITTAALPPVGGSEPATASTNTLTPQPRRSQPTSQSSPTPSPTPAPLTPSQDGIDSPDQTPWVTAPSPTPTRAAVEGFAQDTDTTGVLSDNSITKGGLFFGLILTFVGAGYLVLMRHK